MTTRVEVKAWGGCFAAVALAAGCGRAAVGVETSKASERATSGFSFALYGDSRTMMVLPDRAAQEAEARKLMVDVFAIAVPQKAAGEMVKKHVKLSYHPATKELATMVMPFMTA